ncbi:WRKY DNA-binding transcription factor 70-like isoform X1 [Arachis stenosperma]|uniref:WRKY DNA-binding transcription factor 70-like isoform X1 n=1 Tax=Arachis stenosperma TaxID=217475 RepID=UPI0025AC2436|nr:WRKY DNA-binding transcription factor 70-like isoform X1 [Arachis stenosperma]
MKMIMEDDDIVSREDGIKAIIEEELVRGRDFANQLRQRIVTNKEDDDSADHQRLLSNVLTSFANTLSLLNKYPIHPNPIRLHQSSASSSSSHNSDLLIMQMLHPQIHPCLLTYDNHICKTPPPADTRGSYRRKRNIETWKKETENEREEDGHQWRKYGQKAIQNEKYTRNYFRCTHKYEQGCQATKYVQRIQEKPPLYRATYHGRHTCTNTDTTNNHVLIMEELDHPTSSSSSSIFLSFDNSFPNPPTNPFLSPSSSSLFPSTAPPLPPMMIVEEDRQVLPSTTSTHPVLDDSSRHHVVPILSSSEDNNICWDDMMIAAMSQVLYGSVDEG